MIFTPLTSFSKAEKRFVDERSVASMLSNLLSLVTQCFCEIPIFGIEKSAFDGHLKMY
jgi:hypothetical protein